MASELSHTSHLCTPPLHAEFRGHLPLHKQPRSDLQKASSSLFRQGASQCRPMLPRANSAIEKNKLLSFSRAASAGQPALPSTALLQSTASFMGQPRQRLAASYTAGGKVPCTHRGVALNATPSTHLNTTEQGPISAHSPGGLQRHPPHKAAQHHHIHVFSLKHKITAGPQGLATQVEENHKAPPPSSGQDGPGKG